MLRRCFADCSLVIGGFMELPFDATCSIKISGDVR